MDRRRLVLFKPHLALVLIAVVCLPGFSREDPWLPQVKPETVSLRFDRKTAVFAVIGLPEAALNAICELAEEDKAQIFSVYPVWAKGKASREAFPMMGQYVCSDGTLSFHPDFPLTPGLKYQALFRARHFLSGEPVELNIGIVLPGNNVAARTKVVAVYPSSQEVPANLLKFYIVFSEPMSLDQALAHIRLRDKTGQVLNRPFLDVQDELWDREHRRLTLFLDPGRIKRGLQPNLSEGAPLSSGQTLTLEVNHLWLDGEGQPLIGDYRKSFRVIEADRESPNPSYWEWVIPAAGSEEPLELRFPEPLDYGLLGSGLAVVDENQREVAGRFAIGEAEREWRFQPTLPWRPGRYALQVSPRLEDLAGNNLRRVFDRDLRQQPDTKSTAASTLMMTFDINKPDQ